MEKENISNAFKDSIFKEEHTLNLFTDVTDFSLKQLLNSPLNEVPIIKYIMSIAKVGISIKDGFLIKKMVAFLNESNKIGDDVKEKFKNKIENDAKFSKTIGENLIVILDRYDHLTKAQILAKLFKALIDEKLSHNNFLRLSVSIERTFIEDLLNLNEIYNKNLEEIDGTALQNLYQSGLVSLNFNKIFVSDNQQVPQQAAYFIRNELGTIYCRIIFNLSPRSNLIVPLLSDFETYVFEMICQKEDTSKEFFDYKEYLDEMKNFLKIEDGELRFILNKYEKLGLIENTQKNSMGDFWTIELSYSGFDFYFQKLKTKNELIKKTIGILITEEIKTSDSLAQKSDVSKKIVEHILLMLKDRGIINLDEYANGYIILSQNKQELNKYLISIY